MELSIFCLEITLWQRTRISVHDRELLKFPGRIGRIAGKYDLDFGVVEKAFFKKNVEKYEKPKILRFQGFRYLSPFSVIS